MLLNKINDIWFFKNLFVVIIYFLFCNEKVFSQYRADKNAHSEVFKSEIIEIKQVSDSIKELVIKISNISKKGQLISISKSFLINNSSDIMVSLSYTHITDPLLIPKLQMPWYLIKPNESIKITESVKVIELKKVRLLFDFISLENYPYKKLKNGSFKKYYWYTRKVLEKDIKNDFYIILLKDYYKLFYEDFKIQNFYRDFEIE